MAGTESDNDVKAADSGVAVGGGITDSTITVNTVNARDPLDRQMIETLLTDGSEQSGSNVSPRSPVIRWLSGNATWLGALGAIAGVVALFPVFFGSSGPDGASIVHVEDTTGDVQAAGGDITNVTNVGDPDDKETIASLRHLTQSQQVAIDRLISRLPGDELSTNEQVREEITDAVVGLSDTDSEPSLIKQAEDALAQDNTELAQTLYKADAQKKVAAGQAQLQEAAQSYRHLGTLAFPDNTTAALEAYEQAVEVWPEDIRSWNQLGHLYKRTGQLEQAIEAYGIVGELANSTDEPEYWTAVSFGYLGNMHLTRGELDEAVAMYEKALVIDTKLDRKEGMAAIYGSLGSVHQIRGELDEAVAMYEKALLIDTELERKFNIAANYGNLGIVHKTRGELDQAIQMYEKALVLNTELDQKLGMARNYDRLGVVHRIRGELDQAVQMHEKALMLNTELDHKQGMAINYANLGTVHRIRGELDQAIEMHEKALAIQTELGRKEGMASAYGHLGIAHQTRGELDQAVEMHEKALALNTELGSKEGIASAYANLGVVHQIRGELGKSVELFEKALAINTELGSKEGMANIYGNLGLVHQARGELDGARSSWEQAVELFDAIGSPNADKVRSWIQKLDTE